jgi:hypothetical protein
MARNHGMEQCCKCGTWRKRGWELVTHLNSCNSIRCPSCGFPRSKHGEHYCSAAQYEAAQAAKNAAHTSQHGETHDRP